MTRKGKYGFSLINSLKYSSSLTQRHASSQLSLLPQWLAYHHFMVRSYCPVRVNFIKDNFQNSHFLWEPMAITCSTVVSGDSSSPQWLVGGERWHDCMPSKPHVTYPTSLLLGPKAHYSLFTEVTELSLSGLAWSERRSPLPRPIASSCMSLWLCMLPQMFS